MFDTCLILFDTCLNVMFIFVFIFLFYHIIICLYFYPPPCRRPLGRVRSNDKASFLQLPNLQTFKTFILPQPPFEASFRSLLPHPHPPSSKILIGDPQPDYLRPVARLPPPQALPDSLPSLQDRLSSPQFRALKLH